jgi:hypothetical protein
MTWWKVNARSCWSHTAGALSVGLLKSYVKRGDICTHRDPDAHGLELDASHGGRASLWYVGAVGEGSPILLPSVGEDGSAKPIREEGPVTLVDVNSAYVALFRDERFPVRLISYREDVPPEEPQRLADDLGVIARVTIQTRAPEYPLRQGERMLWPIGQFTTTLTGPELLALREDGKVIRCHAIATYTLGRPFASVAGALLKARRDAVAASNAGWESFAKLLGNSLSGKLAQRPGKWRRDKDRDSPGEWGEFWRMSDASGEVHRLRYVMGCAWEWLDDDTFGGPFTASYCYVTAYVRMMMRRWRSACPPKSVVSQDTDGLWVLPSGLAALENASELPPDRPGALRVKQSAIAAQWLSPRHYYADGLWTLAGFSNPKVSADGRHVVDEVAAPLWGSLPRSAPRETASITRTCRLKLADVAGVVQPDGWVIPHYIAPRAMDDAPPRAA